MQAPFHLSTLLDRQTKKYQEKIALRYKEKGEWLGVSWNLLNEKVNHLAKYFADEIEVQQKVGIFSQNKPECFIVDFALFYNRAISVPMYATSSAEQIEYIVKDADVSVLFVGEQYQYDIALKVLETSKILKTIIVFDETVHLQN